MIIFKVAIRITDPDTDLDLNPDGDAGKMALAEVCTVSMRLVFKCFLKMLFVMVALCNRADHYVFALRFLSFFFLSFFFFSSPNLSGRRLDVYHTSTHGVALVQI